ncbi:RmlC-like cupin domain-containing protein [Ilyonectria sp. MPI-CAGE-AT-0026]|nr:RmlC-like cupin domain-containing protein [Ilyonectria sp. MPI-CAGE-AT-0026]
MTIPTSAAPPGQRSSYVLDQLEGERIAIPGTNSVFRILASQKEMDHRIAVYYKAGISTDGTDSWRHAYAENAFIVTKGCLRIWIGDKCRDLYPGDFAFVPSGNEYGYKPLGPYTELLALTSPGDQVDLFRAMGEEFHGILTASKDNPTLQQEPPSGFDLDFPDDDYRPPELSPWLETENRLPEASQPYFLRANTGPQWIFGGVLSRPFITTAQSKGQFYISALESSSGYPGRPFFERYMSFTSVDHCFCVMEGLFKLKRRGDSEWTVLREGQTVVVSARDFFTAEIDSKFVRVIAFANGPGINELLQKAGYRCSGNILPETVGSWDGWDEARLKSACAEVGAQID